MTAARLREIRLTSFKSFRGVTLPLGPVTVLTGRNSGGKSNALDALEVLSRLAGGEFLSDALDARGRVGGAVRGGSAGCRPHGERSFQLGCTIELDRGLVKFDVRVQVEPELRVVHERLTGPSPTALSPGAEPVLLLRIGDSSEGPESAYSIEPEIRPVLGFRRTALLTPQLPAVMRPGTPAERAIVDAALAVTSALRGIFHLDPVPHLMRNFVPSSDMELRRTGENLSAALWRLRTEDRGSTGKLNEDVIVCYRDGQANSRLTRITELPGYLGAMAGGRIGDIVTRGALVAPDEAEADYSEFNRILGIE
ncbi:AAA family ATPase [Pseudofrankia sp. DC12]|uniref:AAA family ATPase n=1 Tax=Pseudofrankia sp. DC12 TaxID=683315 RepID=UPI000697CEB7|nr:AAA family ATPase [Pseudofrankia sp. DC12]